jgi:DNA invertase Pin-like site-specific DNA recombinase
MRAGLYARVSTHDQQTISLQTEAMRSYIKNRGWTLAKQLKDVGSGSAERPARELLLKTARRRDIDIVVVWRLDRWGRSLADLVVTLRELTELEPVMHCSARPWRGAARRTLANASP